MNSNLPTLNTWFNCPLCIFSTGHWICQCSNTMLAVPPSSFSASFWFRSLSLRSEYDPIILPLIYKCATKLSYKKVTRKKKIWLSSVFHWFLCLQTKVVGNIIWITNVCPTADPGNLFLCSLTGQCYTGENYRLYMTGKSIHHWEHYWLYIL